MIKKTLSVLLLLLVSAAAFCQDTLVRFNDLSFSSEFEQKVFTEYFQNKKIDYFLLFMANGSLLNDTQISQSRQKFYDHLKTLKEDAKFESKKYDKKIKFVYDDIHKTFLQKYELENRFEDIFYNGNYNCVSASALYALAFEECGIPYTLKEEPTHVYLIAYPEQEKIMVETTSPQGGYRTLDQSFKDAYVKMLRSQKLISASEFSTQSVNYLFDKFYFKNEEAITISQLIGIQYANDGLYKIGEKKYSEAYHQFQKSYMFYPAERVSYLMFISCFQSFEEQKIKNLKQARALAELSRFKKYEIGNDQILAEFNKVLQQNLFDADDKKLSDQYYRVLDSSITDKSLRKDLTFLYNYENGRALVNKGYHYEAIPYWEKAMISKNNAEMQNNLLRAIVQASGNRSEEIIKQFEDLGKKYPDLLSNSMYNEVINFSYLEQIARSYDLGNIQAGEEFKTAFENRRDKNKKGNIDARALGTAYSRASVYYFKKGQTSKSREVLRKGLGYDPSNYELLMRQQMIK